MQAFRSLGGRIARAYLLFALGCSLFFAVVAAIAVEGIEVKLVHERLRDVAAWAAPRHEGKLSVAMPSGLMFHHGEAIPLSLRNLPEGVHDIAVDGVGLAVFAGHTASGPYVVVDHASDYGKVEMAVYSLLGVGFLGFIAMSVILGRFMARRIVAPIEALSAAVSARSDNLPLLESNDELGILARAFARHTSQLQQFLERERFFTGDVSHELRTPLTIIAGAAEILALETRGDPAWKGPVGRIARAAHDASESVAILLLLARSPDLIESQTLSMSAVVREEVARYQALVAGKPVTLHDAGGPDFTVRAPARLVSAALGNLIRNACLYTAEGHVTVALEHHALLVRDSGKGLPPAVVAMLNGEHAAVPPRASEGSGLGLALVMRICRSLDVTLQVDNPAQGGTVFTLRFPASGLTPI